MENKIAREVEQRVYVQLYAASATCLLFLSYFVFSLQVASAAMIV